MERSEIRGNQASGTSPAFRFAPCGLRTTHASSFSRVIPPPSFASFSLAQMQGSGAPTGARVLAAPLGGRVTYARRRYSEAPCIAAAMLASRRSTAAIVGSGLRPNRSRASRRALAKPLAVHMSGGLWSRIGAFARSARSGGRAVLPGASRELLCMKQRAGRRSRPAHAMPRESTLGGRDGTTVPQKFAPSSRTSRNCLHPGDSGARLSALCARRVQQPSRFLSGGRYAHEFARCGQ